MIGDSIQNLRIGHNRVKYEKVRYKFTHLVSPERYGKPALLVKRNTGKPKRDGQAIFINLLVKPVADLIQHIEGAAKDLFGLGLKQQSCVFRML